MMVFTIIHSNISTDDFYNWRELLRILLTVTLKNYAFFNSFFKILLSCIFLSKCNNLSMTLIKYTGCLVNTVGAGGLVL